MCPEAGTPHQQNWWRIIQAIAKLSEQGRNVTQQAVAAVSGVVQSTISWLANGAWKKLSKGLLGAYWDFDNFLATLTPEERIEVSAVAHEILPSFAEVCQDDPPVLLEEVKGVVKAYGWRVVGVALRLTSEEVRVKILAAVIGVLPASLQAEFKEVRQE